jgi:hypothetical protein
MPRKPVANLLDFVPSRCIDCETAEDGRVVLLRPKFLRGLLARWVQPHLGKPFYRIRLDEVGSAVWSLVDGRRNVGEIAEAIGRSFGPRVEPPHERVGLYLRELEKGRMIRFQERP